MEPYPDPRCELGKALDPFEPELLMRPHHRTTARMNTMTYLEWSYVHEVSPFLLRKLGIDAQVVCEVSFLFTRTLSE